MIYKNKHNEQFKLVGLFHTLENGESKTYHEIIFTKTKNKKTISENELISKNFKDDTETKATDMSIINGGGMYQSSEEVVFETVHEDEKEVVKQEEIKDIIAISPKGKKQKVKSDKLEEFCSKHKLDLESVHLILEGKQKTHRKWGFSFDK